MATVMTVPTAVIAWIDQLEKLGFGINVDGQAIWSYLHHNSDLWLRLSIYRQIFNQPAFEPTLEMLRRIAAKNCQALAYCVNHELLARARLWIGQPRRPSLHFENRPIQGGYRLAWLIQMELQE